MSETNNSYDEILAGCPDCDLLVRKKKPERGCNITCPRCGAVLLKYNNESANLTLALSLSGLFLFIPACLLPLLKFSVLGFTGKCTMVKASVAMFTGGYWWMGFLVMFCSIIVPFIILSILFIISFFMKIGRRPCFLGKTIKAYQYLTEWTMLDVYMIGLLVALIKLKDFGDVFSGPGLYSFVGLLLTMILATLTFDSQHVWLWLDKKGPYDHGS